MSSLRDKGAVVTDATYVILGATGNTGSIIADALLLRRKKVRVVGRDAGRLERFVRQGAEAFTANVSDAAALTKAFRGARAAYLMLPPIVPGKCPPLLAGGTSARVAAHPLCTRSLYSAAGTRSHCITEQTGDLQPALSLQRRNPARSCSRSQTSGRRDRFLQRAAHLGSEAPTSSPCPLRGPVRWTLSGSHPMDPPPLLFLSSHQSAEPGFSRQVRGGVEARLQRRKAPLLRRSETA